MAKLIDLLDEDKPIAEQKFTCLSFISPEKIIENKNEFLFQEFAKQYHFNKSAELLTKYSNYLSFKYGIDHDEIVKELHQFVESETEDMHNDVRGDYQQFVDKNEESLEQQYREKTDFKLLFEVLKFAEYFQVKKKQNFVVRCFVKRTRIMMYTLAQLDYGYPFIRMLIKLVKLNI